MIITCPACHTQFRIPPASLGASGRNVRCSSCGERWFVEAFTEVPPPPLALGEPVVQRATSRLAALRGARLAPWLAGALLFLLAAAAIAGRNQIAAHLPATAPVYQRLGLSLELPLGIEFRDLGSERRMAAGQPVLVVTGEITNISGQRRDVPPIRVALLGADRRELDHGLFDPPEPALGPGGVARRRDVPPIRVALLGADRRELDHGLFDPPEPALGPGGVARFEVSLDAPPPEASDFSVSFDVER